MNWASERERGQRRVGEREERGERARRRIKKGGGLGDWLFSVLSLHGSQGKKKKKKRRKTWPTSTQIHTSPLVPLARQSQWFVLFNRARHAPCTHNKRPKTAFGSIAAGIPSSASPPSFLLRWSFLSFVLSSGLLGGRIHG